MMSKKEVSARSFRLAGAVVLALLMAPSEIALAAASPGYLLEVSIEHDLDYKVPSAPDNRSDIGRLNLAMVEMQVTSEPVVREEAFRDASAYSFDQLMSRFSTAAGTDLSPMTSSVLAHIVKLVLNDTGTYATLAKAENPRTHRISRIRG